MESLKENLKESVVKTEKEAFEDEIFRIVPTRYKEKAKNIFQFLKLQESFSWNSDGEIIYKNTVIPGSNIAFLVNDFLRNRKSAPEGRYVFLRALNDVNLPKRLDVNKKLYQNNKIIKKPIIRHLVESRSDKLRQVKSSPIHADYEYTTSHGFENQNQNCSRRKTTQLDLHLRSLQNNSTRPPPAQPAPPAKQLNSTSACAACLRLQNNSTRPPPAQPAKQLNSTSACAACSACTACLRLRSLLPQNRLFLPTAMTYIANKRSLGETDLECCGSVSPLDWVDSDWWIEERKTNSTAVVPISCCRPSPSEENCNAGKAPYRELLQPFRIYNRGCGIEVLKRKYHLLQTGGCIVCSCGAFKLTAFLAIHYLANIILSSQLRLDEIREQLPDVAPVRLVPVAQPQDELERRLSVLM
ncbi:uncharacterized protein NPIL_548251 [Nephila pilipes]|uniref:Uncharacterized protein n=1 Tax=Nephila pilipes TaxID=299642 RepID=A0A8X6PUR3_NEPPI|nr:uncharacterized protein NPIL_548251 [Nephila pilipes]